MKIRALLRPTLQGRHRSPLYRLINALMVAVPLGAFVLTGAQYAILSSDDRQVSQELAELKAREETLVAEIQKLDVAPADAERLRARIETLNLAAGGPAASPSELVADLEELLPARVKLLTLSVRRADKALAASLVGVAADPAALAAAADALARVGEPGIRITDWSAEAEGGLRFNAAGTTLLGR